MKNALPFLLILFSGIDRFVITEKLPPAKNPLPPHVAPDVPVVPVPNDEPLPLAGCQCGCVNTECKCGRASRATACTLPIQWDMRAVERFEARPVDVITVFSPTWCTACPTYHAKLGDGDAMTRLEWVPKEAHFTPVDGYPCFYDQARGKYITGKKPETMDDVRRALGITPKPQAHVNAINAGTVDRAMVDAIAGLFRGNGTLDLGNPEVKYAGPVTFVVPAKLTAKWTTTGGTTSMTFKPSPGVRWGLIQQNVSGVVYDGKKIAIQLPYMPDLSLEVK